MKLIVLITLPLSCWSAGWLRAGCRRGGADFVRHLVNGVLKHQVVMDTFIHTHAPEWPLEQMAYVDRNVLRIAIFEFAVDGSTPVKVAINEAVELAKTFGSDSAPRFVNGVLGTLVDHKESIAQAVKGSVEKAK